MRTLMKNQDLLKRVTCFIAAFTLAFRCSVPLLMLLKRSRHLQQRQKRSQLRLRRLLLLKCRLSLRTPRLSRLLLRIRLTRLLIT